MEFKQKPELEKIKEVKEELKEKQLITFNQPTKKKFWEFWKKNSLHEQQEEAIQNLEWEKQIELIRAEEKEKLYRDFDIDALFVEPEETNWIKEYMPVITAILVAVVLIVVAIKK